VVHGFAMAVAGPVSVGLCHEIFVTAQSQKRRVSEMLPVSRFLFLLRRQAR
jgi:hypothetical protein